MELRNDSLTNANEKSNPIHHKYKFFIEDLMQNVPPQIDRNIKRIFYYDESNNHISKLWLKPSVIDGELHFNTDIDDAFVLAGVSFDQTELSVNKDDIRRKLGIPKQAPEIKFKKHFSAGDIIHTISRKRTLNFLKSLDKMNCCLHVACANNFYLGVVDIIDDFIDINDFGLACEKDNKCFETGYAYLKNMLYEILHNDLTKTEKLFAKYQYPNIHKDEQCDFISDIVLLIQSESDSYDKWFYEYLIHMLDEAKTKEMIFLANNDDYILVKDNILWYLHFAVLFPKSHHIYDKTRQVSGALEHVEVLLEKDTEKKLDNYEFLDSKDNVEIQIADVICGIYAQLYTYLNKTTLDQIRDDIEGMDETQLECLYLIYKMESESSETNNGFFYYTVPKSFKTKTEVFFHYVNTRLRVMRVKNFLAKKSDG